MRGSLVYAPQATTPTGVILERAAARANKTQTDVAIKVPGAGYFWPVKPGESAERLANQADTIEAMRPTESASDDNCIVIYFGKGASSRERVEYALHLVKRSKIPVIIQGPHRRGHAVRVVVTQRSEAHRKISELIRARR